MFLCTQIKNTRYVKSNNTAGKMGYKWETSDIFKPSVDQTAAGGRLLYVTQTIM